MTVSFIYISPNLYLNWFKYFQSDLDMDYMLAILTTVFCFQFNS